MSASNFKAVMAEIFRHEGGKSTNRNDPGNWTGGKVGKGVLKGTNMGIAAHAHPNVDIMNLTQAQAREIYRKQYWDPIKGDLLPPGIDLVTMDPAVNSGVSRGSKWLQSALGVPADGRIGPKTIEAARAADSLKVIRKVCATRIGWLAGLGSWKDFKNGWTRRVAEVEVAAVKMATGGAPQALHQGADQARSQVAKLQTTSAGAVTASGGGALTLPDLPFWQIATAITVIAVVLFILQAQRRYHSMRAEAYKNGVKP
jgi:lysozyme family protein